MRRSRPYEITNILSCFTVSRVRACSSGWHVCPHDLRGVTVTLLTLGAVAPDGADAPPGSTQVLE